jgi:mono/diheme cytochrome c family protein
MSIFSRSLALPTAVVAVVALAANCECEPAVDPVAGGELCGSGQIDGTDYAVEAAGSELVIAVSRVDAFGCGALHSHVVLAPQATFTYDLDGAAAGDVKIVVAAANLDPDDPALRLKFLPEGENQELSDGDRETIRGSVAEEVKSSEFSTLEFTFKGLSTIDGDGEATLESKIAGGTSEAPVTYNVKKDGDKFTISGTATIDGAPHGIPRNALGFCVEKDMDLHFTVVLVPGTTVCDGDVEEIPPFEETFFDDVECGDVGFNVVYNEVIGPRCMGCHGGTFPGNADLLRGGATEPLAEWRDFRVDSVRNPGSPLFNKALEYVTLPTDQPDLLTMPPSALDANGLPETTGMQDLSAPVTIAGIEYTTERDLFVAWVDVGLGRNAQCADDVAIKTFGTRVVQGDCTAVDAIHFDTPDPVTGDTAKGFFESSCMTCHSSNDPATAPSAPPVGTTVGDPNNFEYDVDHALGAAPVTHPFYVDDAGDELSFWETSVHRLEDGSMYPGSIRGDFVGNTGFDAFKAWVLAGYCE